MEPNMLGGDLEPKWVLDRTGSGDLFWRRDVKENDSRVKFRCEIEVKEFRRSDYELRKLKWEYSDFPDFTNPYYLSAKCILCMVASYLVSWYIMDPFIEL